MWKSVPKRRIYRIDSSTPKRKAVQALMLRYGGVNVKTGFICHKCYDRLQTLHRKCSGFYKECQSNVMKIQSKRITRMVSSKIVLSASSKGVTSSPADFSAEATISSPKELPTQSEAIVSSPASLPAQSTIILSFPTDSPTQLNATVSSPAGLPAEASESSPTDLLAQSKANVPSLAGLLAMANESSPTDLPAKSKAVASSPAALSAKATISSASGLPAKPKAVSSSHIARWRMVKSLKSLPKKQTEISKRLSETCTTKETILNSTNMNTESDTQESMDFQITQCRPKAEGRQKKAKDPNKPKRPTSAYFYFLADCREVAKREGRSVSKIAEFTKECSAKWREMNEKTKEPFEKKAEFDKERYDREMKLYGGPGSKKASRDPTQPKRPLSGYFLFLADFRTKMAGSNMEHKEILKLAGKEWSELTMEEKTPYEQQSQEEQRKYEIAMAEWRRSGGGTQMMSSNGAEAPIEIDDDDEEDEEEDE